LIRSVTGTSLIEYPGKICSIIFISGCNLHCPFCHNPELVRPDLLEDETSISHSRVLEILGKRAGFVEAVSVTGGEPLLYRDLGELLRAIREETRLSVKLDTNGTLPGKLAELLPLVDFVAMDLKSSPSGYPEATGGGAVFADIVESAAIVRSLPAYEFRTTMVPGLVDGEGITESLRKIGKVRRFVLQTFHSRKTLSREYMGKPAYPKNYLEDTAGAIKEAGLAEEVEIRP